MPKTAVCITSMILLVNPAVRAASLRGLRGPSGAETGHFWINDAGQIAGNFGQLVDDHRWDWTTTFWNTGSSAGTDVTPGDAGRSFRGVGIREDGSIAGWAIDNSGAWRGATWKAGTLGYLPPVDGSVVVRGTSKSGAIIADVIADTGSVAKVAIWNGPTVSTIGFSNASTFSVTVNSHNQALVMSSEDSYLWSNDGFTRLTVAGNSVTGEALNDRGTVVVSQFRPGGVSSYTLSGDRAPTEIAAPEGVDHIEGAAIDERDRVVGSAWDNGLEQVAFLWDETGFHDLNDLLPANSGWQLSYASDINDHGQIVGGGYYNGVPAAFVLDLDESTVPEPGVLGMTTMLAACVFDRSRTRPSRTREPSPRGVAV